MKHKLVDTTMPGHHVKKPRCKEKLKSSEARVNMSVSAAAHMTPVG